MKKWTKVVTHDESDSAVLVRLQAFWDYQVSIFREAYPALHADLQGNHQEDGTSHCRATHENLSASHCVGVNLRPPW